MTVNYSYDSAGNVTNDGVHSYTYDAANRLVSVDSGSTAQYKYDYQNQRVSKIVVVEASSAIRNDGKPIRQPQITQRTR